MIQIRVEGARRFSKLLAEIPTAIRRGASGLSRKAVSDLKERIAAWNKINFDKGIQVYKGKTIWYKKVSEKASPINYKTLVFSRRVNTIGFLNPTMDQLKYKAGQVDELKDTLRLYRSVTNPRDSNFRCEIRGSSIVFGTNVPYADKHINGKSETFQFGATEKRRLRERVPPPKTTAGEPVSIGGIGIAFEGPPRSERLKRIKKKLGSKEYRRRQQNDRAYYILYNWAKKNYPVKKKLPVRNWYVPMSDEVKYSIVQTIWNDLISRRISRMRAQYTAGYEP